MKQIKQLFFLSLLAALAAGCSHLSDPLQGDLANGENRRVIPNALVLKNVASVRIGNFVDARMMGNPRKVGTGAVNAFGMNGKDIILDKDAVDMAVGATKKRLLETGFKVIEESDGIALFELSGVVKELLFSVKARDEVSIVIEATLTNIATGTVLWSGIVVEKNDNFAGVPRVTKEDIASFLSVELDIVSAKMIESISDSLMISNPELFGLTPGIKPIPGVTVLVAPVPHLVSAPVVVEDKAGVAIPFPAYKPTAKTISGMLAVITKPDRAKVYINGVYYGLTPFRQEMEAGLYAVSIKLDGYQMVAEKVMIRAKNITEMDLTLER